jgi:hypothetical protein
MWVDSLVTTNTRGVRGHEIAFKVTPSPQRILGLDLNLPTSYYTYS